MPVKHSYENIFNSFKFYNCELMHNKEDFNNVYVNADSKLKIIASCGHTYSISYHRFTRKKENVINISTILVIFIKNKFYIFI